LKRLLMTNFQVGCVAALVLGTAVVLSSCSKSPTDTAVDAVNAVGRKLVEPLVQKDASAQAERMVAFLADNAECENYKARMREAGRGSPYEATTQRGFVQTQQDACKAGCCKQK
jgi:hypothetical protein